MIWLWIVLAIVGLLLVFFFVLIPVIENYRNLRHGLRWDKVLQQKMPETSRRSRLALLNNRATPPFWEPEAYGTKHHYLYALSAHLNHKRDYTTGTIGGFHDQLKFYDDALGPLSVVDCNYVKSVLDSHRIKDAASLQKALDHNRHGYLWSEAAQSIHLAGHTAVPIDPDHQDPEKAHDRLNIDPHINRRIAENTGILDLRTWRMVQSVYWIRGAATLNYIKLEEAERLIEDCAQELMPRMCRYPDWQSFGRMMVRCEQQMRYKDDDNTYAKHIGLAIEDLLQQTDGPWQRLDIHHTAAQQSFAELIPPHNPVLVSKTPRDFAETFPDAVAGEWLALADRLMADQSGELADALTYEELTKHLDIAVTKQLLADHPENPGVYLIAAIHYFLLGYEARGTGTAANVSNEDFMALEHCCEIAVGHAESGHKLAPDHPAMIAIMLLAVPHVHARSVDAAYRLAHDLADTVFLDNFICQWAIINHRLEKWGGHTFEAFEFARDRMARCADPVMNLLFLRAACEYVENPIICGGDPKESEHRFQEDWLLKETRTAIAALQPLTGEFKGLAQSYCLWWASSTKDMPLIYDVGGDVPFDKMFAGVWQYRLPLDAHLRLTWLKDVAIAGHPAWKTLQNPVTPDVVH